MHIIQIRYTSELQYSAPSPFIIRRRSSTRNASLLFNLKNPKRTIGIPTFFALHCIYIYKASYLHSSSRSIAILLRVYIFRHLRDVASLCCLHLFPPIETLASNRGSRSAKFLPENSPHRTLITRILYPSACWSCYSSKRIPDTSPDWKFSVVLPIAPIPYNTVSRWCSAYKVVGRRSAAMIKFSRRALRTSWPKFSATWRRTTTRWWYNFNYSAGRKPAGRAVVIY